MARQIDIDVEPADRDDRLGEALEAYLGLAESGTAPAPEAFAARYPDLRDDLLSALEGLALVQGLIGEPRGHHGGRLENGRRIAGYRIVRELGRGGMGLVYEAVHEALDRPVALKVLGTHAAPDSTGRRRFLNEARTAAGLHHTHIVPVFDVGQVGGLCYYAMQRIEGSGLDRVIRFLRRDRQTGAGSWVGPGPATPFSRWGRGGAALTPFSRWGRGRAAAAAGSESATGPWSRTAAPSQDPSRTATGGAGLLAPPARDRDRDDEPPPFEPPRGSSYYRWVAEVGREAAEALGHAHRRGIIHRDIKPSNLLVDGRGLVWVADFGLARRVSDPGMSQSDALIGTPRYMSPEQARGAPVDARSDLFSLGATLYELLTLRPAFEGRTSGELTDQITHRDPPPIRLADPKAPRDLETIVLKLLAKRPADRYPSAAELADDLVRFLHHEPVRARRISPLGRLWRFAQRHPGGTAISTVAAATVLAVSALAYARVVQERDQTIRALSVAKDQRDEAERARQQAHDAMTATRAALRNQYWREASLVRLSNRPDRLAEGLGLIREAAALDPDPPLRAQLRQEAVELLVLRDVVAHPGFDTGRARAVAFSHDGSRLAALTEPGNGPAGFGLWDALSGGKLSEHPLRDGRAPGGPGPGAGPTGGGPGRAAGAGGGRRGGGPGFSAAGSLAVAGACMAVIAPDGQGVRLFDAMTGERLKDLPMPGRRVVRLLAAADGHRLITVEAAALRPPPPTADSPAPAPGAGAGAGPGATAAPRRAEGRSPNAFGRLEVNLWDPADLDRPLATLATWEPEPGGNPFSGGLLVAVSPDARVVATARDRGTSVELWSGTDGTSLGAIDPQVELTALALGADHQLATAGSGEIRLWDLDSRAPLTTITPNQNTVRRLRFSPRGSLLAVVGALGRDVELWDHAAHAVVAVLPTSEPIDDVCFSPDGRMLVAATWGGRTPAWRIVEPTVRSRLGGFDTMTRSMTFRTDGLLAMGTLGGSVRFWQDGRPLSSEGLGGAATAAAEPATPPRERTPTAAEADPISLAFDDKGRLVTLEPEAFRVWNNPPTCSAGERIELAEPPGLFRLASLLAPSRDGRVMALTLPVTDPGRPGRPEGDGPPDGPPRGGPPDGPPRDGPPRGGPPGGPPRDGRPPEPWRGVQVFLWRSDEPGTLAPLTPPALGFWGRDRERDGDGDRDRDRDRDRGRFGMAGAWRGMTVAPGGDRLYLIDLGGNLHVWDVEDGEASLVRWPFPVREVSTLALDADGRTLAVGSWSGTIFLYDTASGRPVGRLAPEPGSADGGISALAFEPDGTLLAAGTQQGAVLLWSLDDQDRPHFRLPGHRGGVSALAFAPDGERLATAGSDRVVDVWEFRRLREEFRRLGLGW